MSMILSGQVIEVAFMQELESIDSIEQSGAKDKYSSTQYRKFHSIPSEDTHKFVFSIVNVEEHGQSIDQGVNLEMHSKPINQSSFSIFSLKKIVHSQQNHQADQSISISSGWDGDDDGIEHPEASHIVDSGLWEGGGSCKDFLHVISAEDIGDDEKGLAKAVPE